MKTLERSGPLPVSRVAGELSLTRQGHAIAKRAPEAAQGRLMHGMLAMPGRDVRQIRVAVERIVESMEAKNIEATFFFAGE